MLKYRDWFNEKELNEKLAKITFKGKEFAWNPNKTEKEFNWVWHNGGTGGYSSSMVLDAGKKNGVIILSNVSAFNTKMKNIDNLCFELMKQIENQ